MLGPASGETFSKSEKWIFHRSRRLRRRDVFQHPLPREEVGLDRAVGGAESGRVFRFVQKESSSPSIWSLFVDATKAGSRRIRRFRIVGRNHQRRKENDDRKRI